MCCYNEIPLNHLNSENVSQLQISDGLYNYNTIIFKILLQNIRTVLVSNSIYICQLVTGHMIFSCLSDHIP